MCTRLVVLLAALVLAGARFAAAQEPGVRADRLPIDYKKLETRLRQARASGDRYGLKIHYQVDVYGKAPRIELFTKDDNLTSGPAPYGAPSHREFMNQVTPIEYRPPVPDFGALLRWLTERTKK
jgi:hypothetical protein